MSDRFWYNKYDKQYFEVDEIYWLISVKYLRLYYVYAARFDI